MSEADRIRLKTWLVGLIVILTNVFGNTALTWGMKQRRDFTLTPLSILDAIFSPWVGLGIVLLIVWLLSRMALLSWADLSYVLPVTSLGYVFSAVAGRIFFSEHISWQRWSGTLLIFGGMMLVGSTRPNTTQTDAPLAVVVSGEALT